MRKVAMALAVFLWITATTYGAEEAQRECGIIRWWRRNVARVTHVTRREAASTVESPKQARKASWFRRRAPLWKQACRQVRIEVTWNCVIDSETWVREAKRLGFENVGVASYWKDGDVTKPHQICYVGPIEDRVFIEPQYGWRIRLTKVETDGLHYKGETHD